MDLPCDDDAAADLSAYADTVLDVIGDRADIVVVAQSFGGFTVSVGLLVLVAAMVPLPGESARD